MYGHQRARLLECVFHHYVVRLHQGIKEFGGESLVLVGDVQKADEIQDAIKRLVDESGGHLHLLFPNAGINGACATMRMRFRVYTNMRRTLDTL